VARERALGRQFAVDEYLRCRDPEADRHDHRLAIGEQQRW
jgi:hypothetical protein